MPKCHLQHDGHFVLVSIHNTHAYHYNDVIMSAMTSQITSLMIVYSIVYSGVCQREHQIPASLSFVRGIHRWPVNSPHKEQINNAENASIWWRHHESWYYARNDKQLMRDKICLFYIYIQRLHTNDKIIVQNTNIAISTYQLSMYTHHRNNS